MDRQIMENRQTPFAIVMLDVNDLKIINDTAGHQAGDQYLRDACKIICDVFKHSPVFRVGGDEFAVIAQGNDYACIEERIGEISDHNTAARQTGGVVVACGMAKYENDTCVTAVFERADRSMYENKNRLKSEKRKGARSAANGSR
jgi:FOG: GGDEF domain